MTNIACSDCGKTMWPIKGKYGAAMAQVDGRFMCDDCLSRDEGPFTLQLGMLYKDPRKWIQRTLNEPGGPEQIIARLELTIKALDKIKRRTKKCRT